MVGFCAESSRLNPSSALPFVLGGHNARPHSVLVDLECGLFPQHWLTASAIFVESVHVLAPSVLFRLTYPDE